MQIYRRLKWRSVSRAGYFKGGSEAEVNDLLAQYDATAKLYVGSTGPANLHGVWGLQQVLPLILEQMGRPATGQIAALLARQVPPASAVFSVLQTKCGPRASPTNCYTMTTRLAPRC